MGKKRANNAPSFKSKRSTALENQRKIPTWVWLAGGGVLLVLAVIGLFYLGNQGAAIANSGIEGVQILPDPGRGHQDGDIAYSQDAPVGGVHNPEWQNCGIYEQPLRKENIIHSMEHGAVWIAYQPDLPADQVEILRNLVRQDQSSSGERWVVLAPQPDLQAPIVASAWRVQLRLENAADERLAEFVKKYQRGPFYPEPGATCTFGGIGTPLS
jgi:hypothetical protein